MIEQVLHSVSHLISTINAFFVNAAGGNTYVGGIMAVAVMGSLTYSVKTFPGRFYRFVKAKIFYTYQISYHQDLESGRYESSGNLVGLLGSVLESSIQKNISRWRNYSELSIQNSRIVETMADGTVLSRFAGMWSIVSRQREKAQEIDQGLGSTFKKPVVISITVLRSRRYQLLKYIAELVPSISSHGVYSINMSEAATRLRSHSTDLKLQLDDDVKDQIDKALALFLKEFAVNREARLTILTHGEPGTGKSTIAEYVAMAVNSSLFVISEDGRYGDAPTADVSKYVTIARQQLPITDVPVILADDFDTLWDGLMPRDSPEGKEAVAKILAESRNATRVAAARAGGSKDLFNLLRSLQSPAAYNGAIVILNTNHLSKIDEAVYRPGRVHLMLEIKRMQPNSIKEYFEKVYGVKWTFSEDPLSWRACDVDQFRRNADAEGFVRMVTDPSQRPADLEFNDAT